MIRPDQFERLQDLQEKLCEVIFEEADPDFWPGAGMLPVDMTKEDRGDRYWCKKNAAATFTLLNKCISISSSNKAIGPSEGAAPKEPEEEMGKEISRMESLAQKQLEAFQERKGMKVVN